MQFGFLCIVALAGIALAQTFKSFILVPASIVTVFVAVLFEYRVGASLAATVGWSALAVVTINISYGLWLLDVWARPPDGLVIIATILTALAVGTLA